MWQLEELEAWFNDMHLKGWKLVKLNRTFATFEETQPMDVQYRCEIYKTDDSYEKNRVDFYEQSGWEYVDSLIFVHIYREIVGANPVEIHSDPSIYSESINILKNDLVKRGLLILIATITMVFVYLHQLERNRVGIFLDDYFIFPLTGIITYLYILITMINGVFHTLRLLKKLRSGQMLNHQATYKRKLYLKILIDIVIFGSIISLLTYLFIQDNTNPEYTAIPNEQLPVVQISDILVDEEFEQISQGDYDNNYQIDSSITVPKQYELKQTVEISSGKFYFHDTQLYSGYYEARNEWLASGLVTAIKEEFDFIIPKHFDQVKDIGFDEAWIYENGSQHEIVARNGKTVYRVIYWGDIETDTLLKRTLPRMQ